MVPGSVSNRPLVASGPRYNLSQGPHVALEPQRGRFVPRAETKADGGPCVWIWVEVHQRPGQWSGFWESPLCPPGDAGHGRRRDARMPGSLERQWKDASEPSPCSVS